MPDSSAFESPLQFQPVFRRYLWGGRRLATVLGKPIGPHQDYAESWEIVDHGKDQSVVQGGKLDGQTLGQLMKGNPAALVGPEWAEEQHRSLRPPQLQDRFPLLVKWLDANRNLSLQVHPNDALGARLTPPDLGKTEAWYVAAADPGSKVYAGLKEGVSKEDFQSAMDRADIQSVVHSFQPKVGDCLFIPAGTVHAVGAGLLVAEIQQASDTTYRLDDWGRVGTDGKARPLHIARGIAATDFSFGPVIAQQRSESTLGIQAGARCRGFQIQKLVDCEYFGIDELLLDGRCRLPSEKCLTLTALSGNTTVQCPTGEKRLATGDTTLVPYAAKRIYLESDQESKILIGILR